MNQTVTFVELISIAIKNIKKVVVLSLAITILFFCFSLYKYSQSKNTNYDSEIVMLNERLEEKREAVKKQEEYINNSLLMKVDSTNEYITYVVYAITDIDLTNGNIEIIENENNVDSIREMISSQYVSLFRAAYFDLKSNPKYSNIEDKYLREVISLNNNNSVLTISAIGNNSEESSELANAASIAMENLYSSIVTATYNHTLTKLTTSTKTIKSNSLGKTQQDERNEIINLQKEIDEIELEIKNIKSKTLSITYIAKNTIIGFIVGIIISLFVLWIKYLFGNRVLSAKQLIRDKDLTYLGLLNNNESKIEKIANKVSGDPTWNNNEEADNFLLNNIKTVLLNKQNVLFLSSLSLEDDKKINSLLNNLLDNKVEYNLLTKYQTNPLLLDGINKCDCIILIESLNQSKFDSINEEINMAKRFGKQIVGFILK